MALLSMILLVYFACISNSVFFLLIKDNFGAVIGLNFVSAFGFRALNFSRLGVLECTSSLSTLKMFYLIPNCFSMAY